MDTTLLDGLLTPATSDELKSYLGEHKAKLQHSEGKVAVSLADTVAIGALLVPFHVRPEGGVLAKSSKWNRLTADQRFALARQIATPELFKRCHQRVLEGVQEALRLASENEVEMTAHMLKALTSENQTVEARIQVLLGRIEAAAFAKREASLVQLTRSAVSLADFPSTYPLAHSMPRRFIALLGAPNSGKTFEGIEALVAAPDGVYLAPLRLLALENYERLTERGVKVSMVTGEECRLQEGATHVSSTIEMLNYQRRVSVAVVDEVQMLDDPDRGSAWTAAIVGVPADTVYLVGSLAAQSALESLVGRLGGTLEIRVKERKAPLIVEPRHLQSISQVQKGDAIIAFSRRDVLYWRDELTAAGMTVATIYGNLSPEVRRAQAALFRQGKVDVLVGTDALGMGLNLPIGRVVFSTAEKFTGVQDEPLPAWLTQQIAGRAGRYGLHEEGFVVGLGDACHRTIKALMKAPLPPTRTRGFYVAPTLEHLKQISSATGEGRLASLLERFSRNIDAKDDYFLPANLDEQMERAQWLDTLPLTLEDKFLLSLVPITTKVPLLGEAFRGWAHAVSRADVVDIIAVPAQPGQKGLQLAEDACKLYSAYAWLGYRRPDLFISGNKALQLARETSEVIDNELRKENERTRKRPALRRRR